MSDHAIARPSAIPFGLQNLGSTCFINASLQYLYTAFLRNPPRDLGQPLGKSLVQFCADQNIMSLVNYLQRIFPEKRITYSSGDVNSLVDDICCVLNKEDREYMDYFRIRSHGICKCRSPNYEFNQDLFVLPLVTYKESASNTDLNDLIRQWQKTEDCCHYCPQSVQLSHKLPKCLLMLIEDTNFDPERYKTLQIESRNYELVSFTMHYGSMSGGHETCAAIRNGEWYLFDDSRHVKYDPFNKRQHVRLVMYIQKEEEDTIVQIVPDSITPLKPNSKLKRDITWMIIVKWGLIILGVLFVLGFLGYSLVTAITPVAVLKAGAILKRHAIRSWFWLYRRLFLFNAAVLSVDYIGENWRNFWTYVKKRFAGQKKDTKSTARYRIRITQSTYCDELYDKAGILLGQ